MLYKYGLIPRAISCYMDRGRAILPKAEVEVGYPYTLYPEYFTVRNIHGFSAVKVVLNFIALSVHCWLGSREYITCGR